MRKNYVKLPLLIAALYFGSDLHAQSTQDTVTKENKIEEVVVIGYGTRKKSDNTTSISSISSEEVTKTKVLNVNQAIQGKAAGVQVTASDLPGSTPTVLIRGLGTALGGRDPLYVVDGLFVSNINNINANDILTYDVLKDASALAIYGNRAANGVIIITTKSGKGKLSVEYDGFTGVRMPLKKVKMAGSNSYSHYNNLALGNTKFSQDQPVNTDWFKEITRTGLYNQHNLSVSGSSESVKYFFSLSNYDEKSILKGTDYNRSTIRSNNEFKISKGITLSQNLSATFTNTTPKPLSAFTDAYKQSPIVPVYYANGQYGVSFVGANGFASPNGSSFNNVGNPLAKINFFNERRNDFLLQGGLKLDIQLLEGLKFTSQFSGEYNNSKYYNFEDTRAIWLAADPTRNVSQYNATSNVNLLTNGKTDGFKWVLSNFANYNRTFGDIHDIDVTIGTEVSVDNGNNVITLKRKNMLPNSNYWNLDGTNYLDQITELNSVDFNEQRTLSYFARAQYKLLNRYLITATVRRDGSSQFAEGQKWGTFPSFGAGWIISEESFLKNNSVVNLLKLRGGWGRLGNQRVPLNYLPFGTGNDFNYSFGGLIVSNGSSVIRYYDPNLTWEITEETSGGLDFELLDSRFRGSFDLYNKKTTNLILGTTPPKTSGISAVGYSHVGEVSNKGYEISLTWADKINEDWGYSINGNYSQNKNEIKSLNSNVNPIQGGSLGNGQWTKLLSAETVGYSLGSFYLWEVVGKDSNGNFIYADTNGNGVTGTNDAKDRKFFGSYIPKSTLGVNLNLNYKNLDLSVNGYGAFGFYVYNGKKAQRFSGENIEYSIASDFWTANNTSAENPAPFNNVPIASTYYLEKGDFFRINNITLGWTLQKPVSYMSSLRLYMSAINPFISQKFTGFSPELNGNGVPYESTGIELDAYPSLRSFVFGVNIKF